MNAGAYGGEMKDVITEVTVMDHEGKILRSRQRTWPLATGLVL